MRAFEYFTLVLVPSALAIVIDRPSNVYGDEILEITWTQEDSDPKTIDLYLSPFSGGFFKRAANVPTNQRSCVVGLYNLRPGL